MPSAPAVTAAPRRERAATESSVGAAPPSGSRSLASTAKLAASREKPAKASGAATGRSLRPATLTRTVAVAAPPRPSDAV